MNKKNICTLSIIKLLNGKYIKPEKNIKYNIREVLLSEYENQYMLMDSPNFIFFDKINIDGKLENMRIIYFNDKNPDIEKLIFEGASVFTKGELLSIKPSCECYISIHRYGINRFFFLVAFNEKFENKTIINTLINTSETKKRKYDSDYYEGKKESLIKPMFYQKH